MATYIIDSSHSEINFRVKHMMITNVGGRFTEFGGTMETEGDEIAGAKISFEAETASINTHNEQRDGHLRSDEFFASETYPKLTFSNGTLRRVNADLYRLSGELTIRDVTKPVEFSVEHLGGATDPWGQEKVGFEIEGSILRKDYGLAWDAVTEAGGIVVSNEVKLALNVQLIKQVATA